MTAAPWPNLFVVGAAKCGTTSLWQYLGAHADIFATEPKEPHFFSAGGVPGLPVVKDERAYLALYEAGASARYRLDASPSYLWDERAASAIRRVSRDARIVVSLRDPVERAYSHYWTYVVVGVERRTFAQAVAAELREQPAADALPPPYVRRGFYAEQLTRYLELFGERVFVLFFDDLVADARATTRQVFEWLDLDPDAATFAPIVHFPFARPRTRVAGAVLRAARWPVSRAGWKLARVLTTSAKPPLDAATQARLEEVYRPHDRALEELLGRALPWRRETEVAA